MIRLVALLSVLILTGCTLEQQGAFSLEAYSKTLRSAPPALVGDGVADQSPAIQAMLNAGPGTYIIPNGVFRCDSTIIVPPDVHVLCYGEVIRKASAASTSPVVNVQGSLAKWVGGRITTEKNHPQGIVRLGHHDTSATYTTVKWLLADCIVVGVQAPGNIGLSIISAQSAGGPANFFGHVRNVAIICADVGIQVEEVANSHHFNDILFWNCISAGFRFYGSYGNHVFGGFVHNSTNGIIGADLRNARYAGAPHASCNNYIYGLGVEPGGAASMGYRVDSLCARNTIELSDNVLGGNLSLNSANRLITPFSAGFVP